MGKHNNILLSYPYELVSVSLTDRRVTGVAHAYDQLLVNNDRSRVFTLEENWNDSSAVLREHDAVTLQTLNERVINNAHYLNAAAISNDYNTLALCVD